MIVAGVDAGSRKVKVVLFDSQAMLVKGIADQGVEQERRAREVFDALCSEAGIGAADVRYTVATGYGRGLISFAQTRVTEITCHARGVCHALPGTRTIIEIGGQDNKIIRLRADGSIHDFDMNDRCAAGTGCFLELVAKRLQVGFDEMADLIGKSREPATISSMCAVFAETEIINHLAMGTPIADILTGAESAMARRISAMAGRDLENPIVCTGGGALIPGMVDSLQDVLREPISVPKDPQYTGAMGAALIALAGDRFGL